MSGAKRARDEHDGQDGAEDGTQQAVEVELMDLPDEMLVEIFSFLGDMQEVLRLRAVCRRWRDLLLHPDVWRRREIYGDDEYTDAFLDAVFSLAPCLRRAFLASDEHLASSGALVATTGCALRRVTFGTDEKDALLMAVIVRNQAALGRLREVSVIEMCPDLPLSSNFRVLLKTLCEVEGLTTLDLDWNGNAWPEGEDVPAAPQRAALPSPVPCKTVKSSLVRLGHARWVPDAVLEYLLICHAATLENVDLTHLRRGSGAPVAALLSGASKLRCLRIPMVPDMVLLKKCTALVNLSLVLLDTLDGNLLQSAKTILREATQLKKVELSLFDEFANVGDVAESMFSALAASRCSQVRNIELNRSFESHVELVPSGIGSALAGLPHLRRLKISWSSTIPSAFFEAIARAGPPSLRLLEVEVGIPPSECAHAWFHSDPVSQMLAKNRKLHLQFSSAPYHCSTDNGCACEVCRRGCHFNEKCDGILRVGRVRVFAHPHKAASCGLEHNDRRYHWCELIS